MICKTLIERCNKLFGKRGNLLTYWQDAAENFLPQMADFIRERQLGDELMNNLMTSQPVIACRDLSNSFGTMLRPSSKDWFSLTTSRVIKDTEAKQWLEWASKVQKRAMYDRQSMFTRATKEGDQDFAAFGQTVITVEVNYDNASLLYRTWHLRDCAWCEDDMGQIDFVCRKWKPAAGYLVKKFKDKVHPQIKLKAEKDPYAEVNCLHIAMRAEDYMAMDGSEKIRQPWVVIVIDCENENVMSVTGQFANPYIIPRWQTYKGSQYAYSPAVVAALPDARLIQAMTRVLLEAGEKAVTPPMVATQEAIRSDVNVYAGGITWVSDQYDERLGEVLRPITQDKSGIGFGMEMRDDVREMIMEAFFLNKLNLPPTGGPDMTAYEVGQRVQEYIRNALPLFEPMESEYNGQLCESTFNLLLRNGAFGSPDSIPKALQGVDVEFQFESPLREVTEKAKAQQFMEGQALLAQAMALDPSVAAIVDPQKTVRDVLLAVWPAEWLRTEAATQQVIDEQKAEAEAQNAMAMMAQGGRGG